MGMNNISNVQTQGLLAAFVYTELVVYEIS